MPSFASVMRNAPVPLIIDLIGVSHRAGGRIGRRVIVVLGHWLDWPATPAATGLTRIDRSLLSFGA
jgi:hypothetical protein